MKKLLSIVIFTSLFSVSAMALGTYYGKCVVNVATNSTNYGLVWVTKSENNPPADNAYLTTDNSTTSSFALGSSITAEFWLYNKPNTGYYHVGWSTNANGSSPIANTNVQPYHLSFSATGKSSNPTTKTYYAVFKEQTVYYDYARAEVLLIDGDLGLSNIDIQLGITPSVDFADIVLNNDPLNLAIIHYRGHILCEGQTL